MSYFLKRVVVVVVNNKNQNVQTDSFPDIFIIFFKTHVKRFDVPWWEAFQFLKINSMFINPQKMYKENYKK